MNTVTFCDWHYYYYASIYGMNLKILSHIVINLHYQYAPRGDCLL